jgi:hypothetical protein
MRLALACVVALLVVPAATAKEFRPGDLRICNLSRCVAIRNQTALDAISRLYYGSPAPQAVAAPKNGARMFQLRFRNGYVTGVAAGADLDRFLSFGVNLDQFTAGRWYRVPRVAARELRRLASGLAPLRVTPAVVDQSH